MTLVVGVDGGEALDAGSDVGDEGGQGDIVQALELPDEDPGHHVEHGEE